MQDSIAAPGERGQALIMFTMAIVGMTAFLALVTNVGFYLSERRHLQNSADAAALAGAQHLPSDPAGAASEARSYALRHDLSADEIDSITVVSIKAPNDTVRVKLKSDVDLFFSEIFGMDEAAVGASAAASAGSLVGRAGIAPFAVEQDVFAGLTAGDTTTLKYNATTNSTGNFLPLALDGTGSATYRDNAKYGSQQSVCAYGAERPGCPSTLSTQPGNMIGPTRDALHWIVQNTTAACDQYDEVFVLDADDGTRRDISSTCNRFASSSPSSYRLIIIPVIDHLCNGSCDVRVVSLALFFLEGYTCGGQGQGNSCDVVGRYAKADTDIGGIVGIYGDNLSIKASRLVE